MNYKDYLNSKYLVPVAVVVVVLIAVAAGFFYFKSKSTPTVANNAQSAQAEVKKFVLEVGKLIDLPTGEDPTIATVTDIQKPKGQAFFAKASNGDKVLIYANAKKAILYNPTLKKVLDVAPINVGSPSAQQTATPKPSASAKPAATLTPTPSAQPTQTPVSTPTP